MKLVQATRKARMPRIALYGKSGAGKTVAALQWATAIKETMGRDGPIVFLDTEQASSTLYAAKSPGSPTAPNGPDYVFDFQILDVGPPYTTQRFEQALEVLIEAEPAVIVIDSLAHFWAGEGGCLDQQQNMIKRGTNSFQAWGEIKPMWARMVSKLINARYPIVACLRAKQIWEKNPGKAPVRLGEGPQAPAEVLYEFDFAFGMDSGTSGVTALIDKSRSGSFPPGTTITNPRVSDYVAIVKWMTGDGALEMESLYAYKNGDAVPDSARAIFGAYMEHEKYGKAKGAPTREELQTFYNDVYLTSG